MGRKFKDIDKKHAGKLEAKRSESAYEIRKHPSRQSYNPTFKFIKTFQFFMNLTGFLCFFDQILGV